MSSVLIIARKEFVDLLSNRMVLLVLIAFLVYFVFTAYHFYALVNGGVPGAVVAFDENMGVAADNSVFFGLTWFGTILGIIIGCSTISSERMGSALNTLVVKPVYRDTIINGKLLGSVAFLSGVIVFLMVFYTSALFVLCGGLLAPRLFDYFARLPFVFLFVMVIVMVFLSLSILVSLLVRDQAFAMILSTLTVFVSYKFTTIVSYNVDVIFPGNGFTGVLASFSPYSVLWAGGVQMRFMDTSLGAFDAFMGVLPDFVRLLLFVAVVMVLNYIVFVRRDIT